MGLVNAQCSHPQKALAGLPMARAHQHLRCSIGRMHGAWNASTVPARRLDWRHPSQVKPLQAMPDTSDQRSDPGATRPLSRPPDSIVREGIADLPLPEEVTLLL